MKQAQTTTDNSFSIELLKQLAFMQHEGEDYFILNGKAYEGTEDASKESYEAVKEDYESFEAFCDAECTEVEEFNNDDYYVLTDEEADEKAKEYIEQSLWAFNPSFLGSQTNVPTEMFEALAANGKCEDNNDAIYNCIEDMDEFVEAAISADGRGHFMSSYDGEENEETVKGLYCKETGNVTHTFYIYRLN